MNLNLFIQRRFIQGAIRDPRDSALKIECSVHRLIWLPPFHLHLVLAHFKTLVLPVEEAEGVFHPQAFESMVAESL